MITLSERFSNDIQGKDTYLIPLVIIDNRFYLSTNKLTLENHYDPLVKSIGNIKESIDTTSKKFKISSVSIKFFNFEYNGERITDRLFEQSVMNSRVDIYYKSPSCESLEDCMKLYSGYIRDIKENADLLSIEIEDRTETTLHKKLPYRYTPTEGLPEKHQNKLIPMVYGFVDKSPIVYNISETTYYSAIADDAYISSINVPQIFANDVYVTITKWTFIFDDFKVGTIYEAASDMQYDIINNEIIFEKSADIESIIDNEEEVDITGSPVAFGLVEIYQKPQLAITDSNYTLSYRESGGTTQHTTVPINIYEDQEGTIPTTNITGWDSYGLAGSPFYLDVKNFGDMPNNVSENEYWFFGNNEHFVYDENGEEYYENLKGESLINFESIPFPDDNNIMSSVERDGDIEDVLHKTYLQYQLKTEIDKRSGIPNPDREFPRLVFRFNEITDVIIDFNDVTPTVEYDDYNFYAESNVGESDIDNYLSVNNIGNTNFSIGQRIIFNEGAFGFLPQSGSMRFLMFEGLELIKRAILKDFNKYNLCASVNGRVDWTDGTYTGTPVTLLGGEVGTQQRQEIAMGRPPISRPAKQVKQVKKVADKGSSY